MAATLEAMGSRAAGGGAQVIGQHPELPLDIDWLTVFIILEEGHHSEVDCKVELGLLRLWHNDLGVDLRHAAQI